MSFKDILLKQITHELNVCQHLYTKLEAKNADWKPRENMRSTLELLRYIASIGSSLTAHYVENPPKEAGRERYTSGRSSTADMTFDEFPAMIERQKEELARLLHEFSDEQLLSHMTYHPFNGVDVSLAEALAFVLRVLSAYRHEMFIHAKLCGANINTANNWGGRDMPAPAPKPAVAAPDVAA